jgi:hypothetical protein
MYVFAWEANLIECWDIIYGFVSTSRLHLAVRMKVLSLLLPFSLNLLA